MPKLRRTAGLPPGRRIALPFSTVTRQVPLLVSRSAAAAMLGVTTQQFSGLYNFGWVPRGIHLGRRHLWRTIELLDWYEAGCPDRRVWEADERGEWRASQGLGGNRPYHGRASSGDGGFHPVGVRAPTDD